MVDITRLVITILILVFTLIGILSSSTILFLIYYHRRQRRIHSPVLLTCNTYVAIIISCYTLFDTYAYKLYIEFTPIQSWNNWWCYTRAYLLHVGLCSIYHSYMLQTSYRFFRVVFFKYKHLQTYRCMLRLVCLQWLCAFLLMLIILCFNHFQYLTNYFHCQIPFTDLRGLLIGAWIIYYFPTLAIALMYVYIVHFINRTHLLVRQQNHRRVKHRDVTVLHRILMLILLLIIFCLPAILLWIVYIITGYLYPLIYHFQWLTFAFSLAVLPVGSAFLTTDVTHLITFKRRERRQMNPIIVLRS